MKKIMTLTAAAGFLLLASQCTTFHKEVMKDISLPDDREEVKIGTPVKPYSSADLASGKVAGEWTILTALGKKVSGEETPVITFEEVNHRIYGNNGCNVINGNYKYSPADSTLSFSNVLTTMRACANAPSEADINSALNHTVRYSWHRQGIQDRLSFYDASGNTVMTLMHRDFGFLNGAWTVTEINGTPNENPDVALVFDIDAMKVHGNTGCNILNGELSTDNKTVNSLSFQQLITTRMACPPDYSEAAMLVALEEATTVRPITSNTAEFLDSSGKVVMKLRRTAGSPHL